MKALYSKGIVHRDLKPQNLLLSYETKDPKPSDIRIKIGKSWLLIVKWALQVKKGIIE